MSKQLLNSSLSVFLLLSAQAIAKDKGFRFNQNAKSCLNKKGHTGLNPKFIGECGDLSRLSLRKLKKENLVGKNLTGASLAGLNLKDLDLTAAILDYSNLRGTNLERTLLTDISSIGARINDRTKLPFEVEEALKRGMLHDSLGSTTSEEGDEVSIDIDDIYTIVVTEEVIESFKTFVSKKLSSNKKIVNLISRQDEVQLENLLLALNTLYYNQTKLQTMLAQINAAQESGDYEELNQIQNEYIDAQKHIELTNELVLKGLKVLPIESKTFKSYLSILKEVNANKSDKNFQEVIEIITKAIEEFDITNDQSLEYIQALDNKTLSELAGEKLYTYYKDNYSISIATLLEAMGLVEKASRDTLASLTLENGDISTLTTEELIEIADFSISSKSSLRANNISKVSDLDLANTIEILNGAQYSAKDSIIQFYINSQDKLPADDVIALSKKSYQNKNPILLNSLAKISDLDVTSTISLVNSAQWGTKDKIIQTAIEKLLGNLTSQEIVNIAKASYENKNQILKSYLGKIQNINVQDVLLLSSTAQWGSKDTILSQALNSLLRSVTTSELISLAQNSYENKNSILLNSMNIVSDLNPANVSSLAATAQWSTKDKILKAYLESQRSIKAEDLISLSKKAYEDKNTLLTSNIHKVSNLNFNSLQNIVKTAQWGSKDTIIKYYIANYSVTTQQLITLKSLAYSIGSSLLNSTALNVSDISTDNIITLSGRSSERNQLLVSYSNSANLSTTDILKLASAAQYSAKNLIVTSHLNKMTIVTANELIALASQTYDVKQSVLKNYLGQVSNLSATTLAKIQAQATYNTKDQVALDGLSLINQLTTDQLVTLVKGSYSSKEKVAILGINKIKAMTARQATLVASASQKANNVLTHYYNVSRPTNTSDLLTLVNSASYSTKDSLLIAYIDSSRGISTAEIIALSKASYDKSSEIKANYKNKIIDLDIQNTLILASNQNYSRKDATLIYGLNKAKELTAAQLVKLIDLSYEKEALIGTDGIKKISNLTYREGLSIVSKFSYSPKDTILIHVVKSIVDINAQKVQALADLAYSAKTQILQIGMNRL